MSSETTLPWERPLGAVPLGDGTVRFRVFSLDHEPTLTVGGREHAMEPEGHGTYVATVEAAAGEDYRYVLDGRRLPDPHTRLQPEGLRGPSRIVDPAAWTWHDQAWGGVALEDLVVYELHVGTFTREGTFDAVIPHLRGLAELGVTAIELMPVADFPGRRGWGYDGVYFWAAHEAYGGPDGLQRLVDAAHRAGLGVILDLVLNHVGASGEKAIRAFGPYFTDKYSTFWGQAINYDDAWSGPVREWAVQACEMWVADLHLDGLRLDAIHAIFDASTEHVVAEVARRVHARDGRALVIAESGLNDPKVVREASAGGWGCDAAWADDVHHALRTLVTDEREGYYAEFGTIGDLVHALRDPHVHDGRWSEFRKRRFGAPAQGLPPERFVVFDQNHDQVGNRALGDRLPRAARPLAAFATLLSPYTPMLFMGEEYGEDAPFQFFTDHIDEKIAVATRDGRRREFAAFARFAGEEVPDPQDPATFARSKLTRMEDPSLRALYAKLLEARRALPRGPVDDVRADAQARWLRVRRGDYTLLMNFADVEQTLSNPPAPGSRRIVLATHDGVALRPDGHVTLPPLAGALVAGVRPDDSVATGGARA
ncbi:MAG TPA: malto-oligosyltrehalose trehalohydrolase [Baekduia sp.]|uniref:malto-oligosyltrehalose trehalohydrolase n=1 Tax=Baekduia sp. TaxID=2600305 RepID=UPI002D77691D|nr:malto-oligosyltrehalose trehalohydrolase [Baekduia sp.]HET6506534.1 malto-oligosyltrehalose trehalohydrolase [Baekduia sp.]